MENRTCSLEGCDSGFYGLDLCRPHYRRLKKWGHPLGTRPPRPQRSCEVERCEGVVKSKGHCCAHYMKLYRYGTPTPEHDRRYAEIAGQRFGSLVVVQRVGGMWRCACDCGKERLVSAGDLNRTPESASCGDRQKHRRTENPGYAAVHERLAFDKGPARLREYVDCGKRAAHWSYNHDCPDERTEYLAHSDLNAA